MKRREFLAALAATGFVSPKAHASAPFPVTFRQRPAYDSVLAFVEPGLDEFPGEKTATKSKRRLAAAVKDGRLPVGASCRGISPAPVAYRDIAPVSRRRCLARPAMLLRLEEVAGIARKHPFGALLILFPANGIRYQIRSEKAGRLEYRVGLWKQSWTNGSLTHFEPVEEILTYADKPWFRDVTGAVFEGEPSFHDQLARGVPYWRARLDPACGIDLYGELGIAAADIDGDGWDEIYVCQPGGLPNRLYKNDGNGHLRDISHSAGLDILDNTQAALVRRSAQFRPSGSGGGAHQPADALPQ